MMALVVGPKGEEVYCDEHGRVKVHFPWDRYSNGDEHSSCWVRVSQGWAGGQYGMMALPRVGHEVIVDFLNGDPDQPIIIGRTYHALNTPPYPLPDNKTKTVIRSESHQGSGFNELSFEDQSENEKVYLHAQKDFEAKVNHDHTSHIHNDKHLTVENHSYQLTHQNQHNVIQGERREQVSKDSTLIVDGDSHTKVGALFALEAGLEVHVKGGAKIIVEAGAEITLKAGGSFVKVDASGVSLVGPSINLNSGGSASSGSGFAGQAALLPNGVEAPEVPNQPISPLLKSRQIEALKGNEPICEACEE